MLGLNETPYVTGEIFIWIQARHISLMIGKSLYNYVSWRLNQSKTFIRDKHDLGTPDASFIVLSPSEETRKECIRKMTDEWKKIQRETLEAPRKHDIFLLVLEAGGYNMSPWDPINPIGSCHNFQFMRARAVPPMSEPALSGMDRFIDRPPTQVAHERGNAGNRRNAIEAAFEAVHGHVNASGGRPPLPPQAVHGNAGNQRNAIEAAFEAVHGHVNASGGRPPLPPGRHPRSPQAVHGNVGATSSRVPELNIPSTVGATSSRVPVLNIPSTVGATSSRVPVLNIPSTVGTTSSRVPVLNIPSTVGITSSRVPVLNIKPSARKDDEDNDGATTSRITDRRVADLAPPPD
jgi:hypothetical protein